LRMAAARKRLNMVRSGGLSII